MPALYNETVQRKRQPKGCVDRGGPSMRIAVITGASAGIGREFVYAVDCRMQLDEIWVIARRTDRLEELKKMCHTPIRPIPLDLSDLKSIERYRTVLEREKPEIGILVNAAGFGVFGPFAEKDLEKQLSSVTVNSLALTGMCHISIPYMKHGDSIINMGSNSAWQPVPYQTVYGASKRYVLNFSRALWRELKTKGIHVMCVCPGWIRTEFQQVAHHDEYVKYVDIWYEPQEVAEQAMKDLRKGKIVSILGHPVRRQVRLVKFLPVKFVMDTWCRQQGIE
jgi:short-subunit dehydrogenase